MRFKSAKNNTVLIFLSAYFEQPILENMKNQHALA